MGSSLPADTRKLVREIFEQREYDTCWYADSEGDTSDCGNWPTCNPHCPLRQLADLVGIKPQDNGGINMAPEEKRKRGEEIAECLRLCQADSEKQGFRLGDESVTGEVKCPRCWGKIRYTCVGYDGHIWFKCETPGCLGGDSVACSGEG